MLIRAALRKSHHTFRSHTSRHRSHDCLLEYTCIFVPASLSRYRIMTDCWAENPIDRPKFLKLKQRMTEMEKDNRVGLVAGTVSLL